MKEACQLPFLSLKPTEEEVGLSREGMERAQALASRERGQLFLSTFLLAQMGRTSTFIRGPSRDLDHTHEVGQGSASQRAEPTPIRLRHPELSHEAPAHIYVKIHRLQLK